MGDELLPCPMCGSSRAPMVELVNSAWTVVCDYTNTGCGGSSGTRLSEEDAIAAWNRRTAAAQPSVWMPIESAPHGQDVIVTNGHVVGEGRCHDEHGWFWAGTNPTDATDGTIYGATLWMPLPPPPCAGSGEGE